MEPVWTQAALDAEDIELAKQVAQMALDYGAQWLEAGTPLLYRYGHGAIGEIRRAAGKDALLVADYKCPIARLCAKQAAEEGANFLLLTTVYNEELEQDNVTYSRSLGLEPIFHLSGKPEDFYKEAKKLEDMGAKYLFTHRYARLEDGTRQDNLRVLKENCSCKIGITSDDLEEAADSVRQGADWITFGVVLRQYNPTEAKKWMETIRTAR